ncbi:MAG: efflux RND transporter permease subunit, partial [Chloroflexota bacterium]|nr:efflux RND transporter permease subunit [Chloroflexota bacterium]
MRSLAAWSVRFPVFIVAVAAGVMFFGVTQLPNMPTDVLPEFTPPTVEIQTEALGLSAEEVEQLITVPLEADLLTGVAWVDEIHSESVAGLSSIVLVFEPGTELMRARQVVQERLTQAHALPNVSRPPQMLQPLSSSSRVMMVGLTSDELSPIEMSVLARWTIRPRLMGVPGVANVAIWGQRERQLQVQVDPARLREAGVSLLQIVETAGNALWVSPLTFLNASTPGTGGFIDTPNQRLTVQHILPIVSADDLARVPLEGEDASDPALTGSDGRPLRLGDVAQVIEDHQPLIGDAVVNDGAGLLLVVEKFPNANTVDVTTGVDEALAALAPGLSGIEVDSTVFRPAAFIDLAIDNVTRALLIGTLLIALVLGIFFFSWRSALIALVVIPLSLLAGVIVLHVLGATMNALVLAGLAVALGVVIDDAIADVENVVRRLRDRRRAGSLRSTLLVIGDASGEIRSSMLYATVVLLLAAVPALVIGGLSGSFLLPLVASYVLAVLTSTAVAVTVTPALAALLLSRGSLEHRESPVVASLQRAYSDVLSRVIRAPRVVMVPLGVIVLLAVAMASQLDASLVPSFNERDVLIEWDGAPGTSQPEMNRIAARASRELRSLPGVRNVGAHVGRAIMSDRVVGASSGELWVSIDPSADYDATLAAIQDVVDGYPGLRRNLATYSGETSAEVLAEPKDDIVVRVYG